MLNDIPSEIVSEVASYLSYKDVVALRKALTREDHRNATNAHLVWLNLATRYLAENPHSDLSNIPCLFSLTTNQLRQRFEKRLMVNDIWRVSKEVYPTIKRLRYLSSPMYTVKIAPGGQWVFGGTDQCTVCYWDLDADDSEPRVLIPPDDVGTIPGRDCAVTGIDFAVERGDQLSGFLFGFIGCDVDGWCEKKSQEWIYIYDVVPQEKGTLKAKRMKTLPLPYDGAHANVAINEHLAARSMENRVDVYWWKECTETHLVRCTRLFRKAVVITNIYVLGSDKLLVYTRDKDNHKGRLYALEPDHSEVGEYQEAVSDASKIWSFRFSSQYYTKAISKLYFDGKNYRQTIATSNGILMLTIPALQANEPTLVRVSDFNLYHRGYGRWLYGLGSTRGYCTSDQKLYRFGYEKSSMGETYWNCAAVDPKSNLNRILGVLWQDSSFDEELGRYVSTSPNYLVLQDFSVPLYNIADVCPDFDDSDKVLQRWW